MSVADDVEAAIKKVIDAGGTRGEALAAGRQVAKTYSTADLKAGHAKLADDIANGR